MEWEEIYQGLIEKLSEISDGDVLIEADRQLSAIEDQNQELLKKAAPYMIYLPQDKEETFRICVLGSSGHCIAHLVELLYRKAEVYWITNAREYIAQYSGTMDYLIVAENLLGDLNTGQTVMHRWERVLRPNAVAVCKADSEIWNELHLYNLCCITGLELVSVDSNHLTMMRKRQDSVIAEAARGRYKHIYVACPAGIKTGGPELLHQLVFWLNKQGFCAEIAYVNTGDQMQYCHPEFLGYVVGHIVRFEDIEDMSGNAVVVPEGWSTLCMSIQCADILFWWLSVDNFIHSFEKVMGENPQLLQMMWNQLKQRVKVHLVQSEYARRYVLQNGVPAEKIQYLSDYINQSFLDCYIEAQNVEKEDLILYNPKKGMQYVKELRAKAPELQWKAIENMTTHEVGELLRKAKVYIDFGNHPGKDRIPREAALSGCIVITGRKGSAAFCEDVPIPEKYKPAENENSYESVIKLIKECMQDYELNRHDFDEYRRWILREKDVFVRDVISVFG